MRSYVSPKTNRQKAWYACIGRRRVYLCPAVGNTRMLKRKMLEFQSSNAEFVTFRKI